MSADVLRFDLRLRRRVLISTTLGAAAYLLLVIAVYPAFRDDRSLNALVSSNPTAAAAFGVTGSITSPAGWLDANMYANIGPLLALLLTIGYGSHAIAGQDADGTLSLIATLPLTRGRILAQKTATLLVIALAVPVASFAACLAGPRFELQPSWGALVGVTVSSALLAFGLGALALLVGAFTGSRGAAMGAATTVAAAAYLIGSLAPAVSVIHSIRWVSPFWWAVSNGQLDRGLGWTELGALVMFGALMCGLAVPAFRRLDVH